ncbi:MAG TPA: OmpA family protein [Flavobacterium sp.]|nr:OmpA family protein [Flavobacterium sp.]
MKKIAIIITLGVLMVSCKNEKKTEGQVEEKTEVSKIETTKISAKEINWDEIPELKDIGDFPFVTAPKELIMYNEKDGLTEVFNYETMENFTGSNIVTTEGKLGILYFSEEFNQKLFDKSFYDYFDKIGAKQLYKGDFPEDEKQREQLAKNMWNGKISTYGLQRQSNTPFAVYAFKNNNKKYILNIQSNSAQGNVFIMELKDFEQTIKKYSAEQMKTDIDKTGKAILNINFDTDKATLKANGQKIVDEIYALLNTNPNLKISIEGHTDNVGSVARNKQLSTDRANTVMYALAGKGIDIKRLKAAGFGSEKPIKANDTDENKEQNRRVELVKF